ncbi:MAG: GNAT family N-acetyltransferase [Acidimicrobiales bacterium]
MSDGNNVIVVVIRSANVSDLPPLPDIERAAGAAFAEIGMEQVANGALPSVAELEVYRDGGRCWVAVEQDDGRPGGGRDPVAYIIVDSIDGCAHIEQVSVDPDAARRGIGRLLIKHVERWAARSGLTATTLTTFIEVPWNGPYYLRLGYRYLEPQELTPGLREIRAAEAAAGLDRWPRAAMRKDLTTA